MDPSSILSRLISLNDDRTEDKPAARENMLIAAQALVTSLQTPSEFISCIGWAEPARFACMRTAIDLEIFEFLAQHQVDGGTDTGQLAKATGAEEGLIGDPTVPQFNMVTDHPARLMRHLAAMNIVAEPEQGRFVNTRLSSQLTESKYRDGILYCHDVAGPSFNQMSSYLNKTKFKQPLDPTNGPFQFAHKTQNHFFSWLQENPAYLGAFANYMAGYREGKKPWFAPDFYPVQSRLIDDFSVGDADVPFLVDVGGGKGHDLVALSTAFQSLPGQLILQDKPEVIASIEPPLSTTNIRAMTHDFFTPQPLLGARAYFLHSVLHDWDDENCVKILEALKPALKQGYSKLLVHELIVPDQGATWGVTSMDWLMMALGSVRERTESDFRRLFEMAGLVIDKIWMYEPGTEGIIEASLPI